MASRKIIYWRPELSKNDKGLQFANVHLLVGYNKQSITDFQKMANELRKTFPKAKDNEISGGRVSNSDSLNEFTIIRWSAYLPEGEYKGWEQVADGKCEYCY